MAEEKKTTGAKKTTTKKTTTRKTTRPTTTKKVEKEPVVETTAVVETPAPVEEKVEKPAKVNEKKSSWALESEDRLLYFIFGATFLAITLICSVVYIAAFAATIGKTDDQYKVFTTMFMFFFIPSVLTSIISVIFNTLSLKSNIKGIRIASIVLVSVNALLLLVNLVLSCIMIF